MGRTGYGPLRVAWDTDILIDWRDFGRFLLSDDEHLTGDEHLPANLDAAHMEDLVALGQVMNRVWCTRDMRIHPLRRQLRDVGRYHGERRQVLMDERTRQLDEVASALWCVGLGRDLRRPVARLPARLRYATWMAKSQDRALVEEAIASGCHVFLTRDRKVLRHSPRLATLGMVVLRPSGFLDELLEAGALYSIAGPDGTICDHHKFIHLKAAAGAE
jgi:hypothetical protein